MSTTTPSQPSFWSKVPRWVRWALFIVVTAAVLIPLGIILFSFAKGRDVIILSPKVDKIKTTNKELKDEKGITITNADLGTAVDIGKSILAKLELK